MKLADVRPLIRNDARTWAVAGVALVLCFAVMLLLMKSLDLGHHASLRVATLGGGHDPPDAPHGGRRETSDLRKANQGDERERNGRVKKPR